MATVKRPPRGRIIKPSVKEKRESRGRLTLPIIHVSGKHLSTTSTADISPMSHEGSKNHKVRVKQTKDKTPHCHLEEHTPAGFTTCIATPQLAENPHPMQEPVPYRFSFRKSEEHLETPDSLWQSGLMLADRDNMFSRERSYVLSTPFNGTRPQNDFDKEKLSELQIVVGDGTVHDKPSKRRLLRKPLPFSHYKKSQKVRIIHPVEYGYESSYDSLRLSLLGQQASDTAKHEDPGGEEDIKKQSKKLVTTWLKQIDRKIDKNQGGDVEREYLSDDESDLEVGVNKTSVDKSLQEKQARHTHRSRKSGRLLPVINSMSPQSKMSAQYLDNIQGEYQGEMQENREDFQNTSLNLPAISTKEPVNDNHVHISDTNENIPPEVLETRKTESHVNEFDSEHLPSILLPSGEDSELLERERLKLIHLDKHGLDIANHLPYSIHSEPCYPSFAMNSFNSKGTSSRSITHKNKSLRDMASAFKSRMGYAVASPTHCGDRMWKDRISNYSSTVIHHESYDHFARQKFPKPKPNESSGSDPKNRIPTFANAHGTFRKPLYERNTSARSLSEDSGRSKRNKSGDQLTKIKLKTREFSNASLNSLNSSMKSDRNSGVFRGRKFSGGSQDPDTTKTRRLHRSDSTVSLNSVKGSSKKGSSKLKRRGSKHRAIGIGVNE